MLFLILSKLDAGSYGPIAVGNNLYAPGYLVAEKTNLTACTPNASGFAQYGLAVGGSIINGGTPKVTGNVYVSGTGTATLQLPSCSVKKLIDSQQFDFAAAKTSYLQASEHLAKLIPNLRMNSTFALSPLGTQADPQYNVITLNTCLGPILGCFGASFTGNLTGLLSTAGVITNLSGYKGPTAGTKWPSGATLVINVPVAVGAALEIDSDTPSIGTDPCRTIWNIYAVNIDGSHTNGPITLSRNTKISLQGFILAPNAAILDGPTGNFAGLLVANNYNWQTSNVNILDFSTASGGVCKAFLGCVPNQNASSTSTLSSLSASKTVSSSSASSSPASSSVTSKSNVISPSSDVNGGSSGTVTSSTAVSSPSVIQTCDLSKSIDLPSLQLAAFNGIFLNDFTSSITANLFGQAGSYGPIAVGNNLYAPGYLVAEKTNLTACTLNASGFAQYGLAVGGSIINGGTPKVTGNVYVSGTGTATLQLPSCSVKKLIDSQQFDFAAAKASYLQASEHLAKLIPNLRLNSTFGLSSLGTQADPQYNVITLNTCLGPILGCFGASFNGNLTGLLSTAGVIADLSGYKGPTAGTKWPSGATLVINVPVVVGTTLVINSDTPSVGTDPCRTIWNIYAVNIDGSHTNGPIILSRNTKLSLQGFILAPNAAVLDGPTGNFAGLLVSNNYKYFNILTFFCIELATHSVIILDIVDRNTVCFIIVTYIIVILDIVTFYNIVRYLKVKLTTSTTASSPSVTQTCDLSKSFDLPSLQLAAFNGIFLNDFTSSITANLFGQAGSYGPIAVGNNLYAPGYLVAEKTNLTACTPNASGFAQYGLAVGGSIINGGTPKVTGNVYVSGTGTATLQLPSCSVKKLIDSQQFDFAAAKISYLQASEHLAKLTPNLRMNSTFGLSSLGTQADPQYNVITLNTCLGPILGCFGASFNGNLTGLLSTAGVIADLSGYKGPTTGTKWPSGATLVINVPVVVGTTLVINSDTPSVGTDPCRTIWNIYAVNIDGSHTNGPIILSRNTKLSLQGFILAPNAAILDGPTGNFAGLLVSNNYNIIILDIVNHRSISLGIVIHSFIVLGIVIHILVIFCTVIGYLKFRYLSSLQLAAFNGIFLNDFTSSITANLFGQAGSYGPIAVGNNLYAPGYLVAEKTNLTACTPNASGFAQYGLAVGGSIINGGTPKVTGNVYVSGTGTATLQLPSCSVRKLIDSQQFDFAAAKISYLQASEYLAKLTPNLRMNSTFALSSLGTQADPQYNVITLNTCLGPILGCFGASFTGNLTGLLSTAGVITDLSGYKGPTAGTKWPSGATLVINVPVGVGAILEINSDTPSVGTDSCRTIWNIYPVNIDGSHTNGPITLSRNTKLSLQGFILAPNAAVLDGPTGNFAGLLISSLRQAAYANRSLDVFPIEMQLPPVRYHLYPLAKQYHRAQLLRRSDILLYLSSLEALPSSVLPSSVMSSSVLSSTALPSSISSSAMPLSNTSKSNMVSTSSNISGVPSSTVSTSTAAISPSVTLGCDLSKASDLPSLQLAAFNGIILNDFVTTTALTVAQGGKSYGPMAVLGNVIAPNYHFSEQSNLTACSASHLGFEDYGLVVKGNTSPTPKAFVRGNAYLSGSGSVTVEGTSCTTKSGSSSIFDPNAADAYKSGSNYLATLRPDLKLENINVLSSVGPQANPAYHVITLNSCSGITIGCVDVPYLVDGLLDVGTHPPNLAANISLLSDARGLLGKIFNYEGLSSSGIQWPKDATLVINVPILETTILILDALNPSIGTDPCRTIWNFFPVDAQAKYAAGAAATLIRGTNSPLTGLIMAPLTGRVLW
ncbi:hypothetical protein INT44_002192 [Umbelopsis vinacea]|uniref:Choice-of-anchor A domain-containing protein n=1 Tax=Umbelopsis vinacea TaxID=44442 RepID=A0A8H7Q639_9FUNG|nr:hypothetical protein INT44_002192 [Umbelopsis vinacea]